MSAEERAKRIEAGLARALLPQVTPRQGAAEIEPPAPAMRRMKPLAGPVTITLPDGTTRTRRTQRPDLTPDDGGRKGRRHLATWWSGVARAVERCNSCDARIEPGQRHMAATDPTSPRHVLVRCTTCGAPDT